MESDDRIKDFIGSVPGPKKNNESSGGGVNFADFVCAYCDLFAGVDPDVRAGDELGRGQRKEINERIKILKKTGHVSLVPQTVEDLEEAERVKREKEEEEEDEGDEGEEEEDDDEWDGEGDDSEDDADVLLGKSKKGKKSKKKMKGKKGKKERSKSPSKSPEKKKTKVKDDDADGLGNVRELATLKQIFDRFSVDGAVTTTQCIQALHE